MDTFLSTLSQITSTLIALLLAAVATYFVFLQGKTAEYDDQIASERVVIRGHLAAMQAALPTNFAFYLPPEFREKFSNHHGNVKGPALVNDLVAAVLFPKENLYPAYLDVASEDTFGRKHLQGRAFIFTMTEILQVLTEGSSLVRQSFKSDEPEPRGGLSKSFPSSASGPGFEQWRQDFDRVSTSARILQDYSHGALDDFSAFQKAQFGRVPGDAWSKLAIDGSNSIFENLASIRASVSKIDEWQASRSRYSFARRVHWTSLLALTALSCAVGIVFPMLILAFQTVSVSTTAATSVLAASLVLTLGALFQFGHDIIQPLTEDKALYLRDRWLQPMLQELRSSNDGLVTGSTVQLEHIGSFLESSSAANIPPDLRQDLAKAADVVAAYNRSVASLNMLVLTQINTDPNLSRFLQSRNKTENGVQSLLQPINFVDRESFEKKLAGLSGSGNLFISVETPYAWGSRVNFSLFASAKDHADLLAHLSTIQARVSSSDEVGIYKRNRDKVHKVLAELEVGMRKVEGLN